MLASVMVGPNSNLSTPAAFRFRAGNLWRDWRVLTEHKLSQFLRRWIADQCQHDGRGVPLLDRLYAGHVR